MFLTYLRAPNFMPRVIDQFNYLNKVVRICHKNSEVV